MRQATRTAAVLCVMLAATASFEFAYALPYSWSEYYRDALYRNQNAARFQQQCPVKEASIACKSARLTAGGSNTFVHVCPNSGGAQPICYNSKLPRCCRSNVERGALQCASATQVTVGGHQVTIGIYKNTTAGYCVYFDSTIEVRSCCDLELDEELPCVCVPKRDIYFVLDTTESIGSEIFCAFGYVIQLIEAAINPSGTTEKARVSTILYEYDYANKFYYGPTHLFQLNDSCNAAVKTNIPRVIYEYYGVEEKQLRDRDTLRYPQVGAKSTLPNSALSKAYSDITTHSGNRPATVIILTDGKSPQDVTGIINKLKEVTVDIIAAGIGSRGDINEESLKELASSNEDVVYEKNVSNVVSFAKKIVKRMRATAALCSDQADRILAALNRTSMNNLSSFCSDCMFTESPSDICKDERFPQCGANNLQIRLSPPVDNKGELEKLILEEQILAEVEEIMKMRDEQRKQQQAKEDFNILLTAV